MFKMANKIKLGAFYMDNEIINPNTTTNFKVGSFISINTNNSDENNKVEWVKVDSGSKHYLIATHNLLNKISYNDLDLQGLIKGIYVTLDGIKYILRVLSGGNTSRTLNDKNSKGTPTNNEWDEFICNEVGLTDLVLPVGKDLTGTWTDSDISGSDNNNLWHWYKQQSICQELNSNNCTFRGGEAVSHIDSISYTDRNETLGWRPILEKYNYAPIISDSSRNIGYYTMNIERKYTVTDTEGELLEVEEFLDDVSIRKLESMPSGSEIKLTLINQWDSLSNATHRIKINVIDTFGNLSSITWTFDKLSSTSGSVTSLTKPSIKINKNTGELNPINALENNNIYYSSIGGDMKYANELSITDNSNNVIIYDRKNTTFDEFHTIPAGSLTNGKEYQLKLRTYNENGQYSEWSNLALMKCVSPIELNIINIIDGEIRTQNPLFLAEYKQNENLQVVSYMWVIYKRGVVVDSSGEITGNTLEYQCTGLENKTNYTAQLTVKNSSGQEKTIMQDFYCTYIQARLNAILKCSMNNKQGSVKLESYIRQIMGYLLSGDKVTYINGEEADLHNSVVRYDENNCFYLDGSYTMQMWIRDIEDDWFNIIYNKYGYTTISKYKNVFFLDVYLNGGTKIYSKFYTLSGDILSTDMLYFYVQYNSKNGFYNFEVHRVNNGKSTWFIPSHSDDKQPTYYKENGFLNNVGKYLKSIIIPKNNSLFRLPSIENLIGDNRFEMFNEIHPETDSNYDNMISGGDTGLYGIIGKGIIGVSTIGSSNIGSLVGEMMVGYTHLGYNGKCMIAIKDNYISGNPFNIKYKIYNSFDSESSVTIFLDGEKLNTLYVGNNTENIIDLTDVWEQLNNEQHVITIEVSYKEGLKEDKKIIFKKGQNLISTYNNGATSYYTSSVSGGDLYIIDDKGVQGTTHPNSIIGNKYIIDIPLDTLVTKSTINGFHILKYNSNTKNEILKISELGVGEKIKDVRTTYNEKCIEFEIAKINRDSVTLITNIVCLKEFDSSETIKINGNNDWNLSNIKQWLNNNEKLVEI